MPAIDHRGSRTRRLVAVATHLLFLIILFVLPELMMNIARPHRQTFEFYPGFYLKTLVYISIFYINYYVLVDRTIGRSGQRSSILKLILSNLGLMVAGLALCYVATDFFTPWRGPTEGRHYVLKFATFLMRDAVMMVLTIGLAIALRLSARWQDIDREHQEILSTQRQTELDSLKSQLNPHFLFNTLNTIYALVDINQEDAKAAVHRLSGLLRYMLYDDHQEVPLNREVDFIRDYVALMRIRLSRRPVNVHIEISGHENDPVPPLLLLPLIENAFKYGATGIPDFPISISIETRDGKLLCNTENAFTLRENPGRSERNSGIGLANLERRLALIYGNKASLRTKSENNIFTANLSIPLAK